MNNESAPKWRRLEPDKRKEQMLKCAAKLFSERSYTEVSTSDIAAAAGVARGLINHYFGTKRELYLQVVRKALTVPITAIEFLAEGPVESRADAAVNWFLDMISTQEKMWLTAITPEGIGRDVEVDRILEESDRDAADRLLEVLGISLSDKRAADLNATVRAYGGMVKAAGREWLMRGALTREQVQVLLSTTLITLIREVFPKIQ